MLCTATNDYNGNAWPRSDFICADAVAISGADTDAAN